MSWDIVIFSSKQKITSLEDINEELFVPIDFCSILDKHFTNIFINGDHRQIKGDNYAIDYFYDMEPSGNMLFNLYGEHALFELIRIAKTYHWQIFDTGNGEMIDLENPEKNGYKDFQNYLQYILTKKE
jgi:hypothetical protein